MADNLYQKFIQKSGPRQGQNYKIKRGKSGLLVKVYDNGDTALVNRNKQSTAKLGVYDEVQRRRKNPRLGSNPYA